MPHTLPVVPPVATPTAPTRDRAIDVARLGALLMVMFGHCALLLATIDASGVRVGNLLGEIPAIQPLTWIVQVVAVLLAVLLAAAAVVDQIRFAAGTPEAGGVNFVVVWLIPVVIGVAYARRLITPRAAIAGAVAAFSAQVALVLVGAYDVSLVVTGVERISNTAPPTFLLALHCTWMSCVFVAAAGAIRRWAARPAVWRVVAVGNGGAMTLYLWHIPAIAIAAFSLHALGFDAYDVHAAGFWAVLALRAVVFALVMAVLFRLLSPLEHRPLPWWDSPVQATGTWSTLAGVLVCISGVAVLLLAKFGLGDACGLWAMGGFLACAVAARKLLSSSVIHR